MDVLLKLARALSDLLDFDADLVYFLSDEDGGGKLLNSCKYNSLRDADRIDRLRT